MNVTKALIVDDHPFVLGGIATILRSALDAEILESCDAESGYRTFVNQHPELVVTDISLPGASGLELVRRIRNRDSDTKIIVLSMYSDPQTVNRALEAGADAFIAKTSAAECLEQALTRVLSGHVYIDPDTSINCVANAARPQKRSALDRLSAREYQLFVSFAKGMSAREIAAAYHISINTVGNHRRNIFRKLGVRSTIDLALIAVGEGIIEAAQ
ncbi:MAG: response regulator transcription factor [Pseudomonadota bacterium]